MFSMEVTRLIERCNTKHQQPVAATLTDKRGRCDALHRHVPRAVDAQPAPVRQAVAHSPVDDTSSRIQAATL